VARDQIAALGDVVATLQRGQATTAGP